MNNRPLFIMRSGNITRRLRECKRSVRKRNRESADAIRFISARASTGFPFVDCHPVHDPVNGILNRKKVFLSIRGIFRLDKTEHVFYIMEALEKEQEYPTQTIPEVCTASPRHEKTEHDIQQSLEIRWNPIPSGGHAFLHDCASSVVRATLRRGKERTESRSGSGLSF